MEEKDHRADNPYTTMEGYEVYDAPSDVLKYVVVNGRAVLADGIEVDADAQRVSIPYGAAAVESAPRMEDPSGAFDDAVREHYAKRA